MAEMAPQPLGSFAAPALPDGVALITVRSSPLTVAVRFCSWPFQFGKLAASILKIDLLSAALTVEEPKYTTLPRTTALSSSGVPASPQLTANLRKAEARDDDREAAAVECHNAFRRGSIRLYGLAALLDGDRHERSGSYDPLNTRRILLFSTSGHGPEAPRPRIETRLPVMAEL